MPHAMYSCGDTVLPVWPTWNWCGYQPASVAAREAPTAAPSESASFSIRAKFSPAPTPRPPETTIGGLGELGALAALLLDPTGDLRALGRIADGDGDGHDLGGALGGLGRRRSWAGPR